MVDDTPNMMWLVVLALLGALPCQLAARDPDRSALHLELSVRNPDVLPYEPVYVVVTLTNGSADSVAVSTLWPRGLQVEYRVGDGAWAAMTRWWLPDVTVPPPPAVAIEPGDTLQESLELYSFSRDFVPCWQTGDSVSLRVSLAPPYVPTKLVSSVVEVPLRHPEAGDQLMLDSLLPEDEYGDTWRPARLLHLLPHVATTLAPEDRMEDLRQLLAAAPESRYAQHLRRTYLLIAQRAVGPDGVRAMPVETARLLDDIRGKAAWLLDERLTAVADGDAERQMLQAHEAQQEAALRPVSPSERDDLQAYVSALGRVLSTRRAESVEGWGTAGRGQQALESAVEEVATELPAGDLQIDLIIRDAQWRSPSEINLTVMAETSVNGVRQSNPPLLRLILQHEQGAWKVDAISRVSVEGE